MPTPAILLDASLERLPLAQRTKKGWRGIAFVALLLMNAASFGACGQADPEPAPTSEASAPARNAPPAPVMPEPVVPEPVVPEPVVPEPVAAEPIAAEPVARSCPDHSGHWSGTWSASSSRGTWTADFTEQPADGGGVELHGDIRVRGTACGTGGHIVGRILEDCSVEFDPYRTGPCRVRYQASFEGEQLTGRLAATGFGMADQGRWQGRRRTGP